MSKPTFSGTPSICCLFILTHIGMLLSGCAIGNYGSVISRQTYTCSAKIVEVASMGLHIRPDPVDRGVSLGLRSAHYIFPNTEHKSPSDSTGWKFFANLPKEEPVTRTNTSIGLELQLVPDLYHLSGGYWDQVITYGPPPDVSKVIMVFYNRNNPQLTFVSIKEGINDSQEENCK